EPHSEIWTMDLDPNLPTVDALGPARTAEQHLRDLLAACTRSIETDPLNALAYSRRAAYYDRLHERAQADADMKRWSAVMSGKSPLDLPSAELGIAFGQPTPLDSVMPFLKDAYIESFSADGREMFLCSWRSGGRGDADIWVLKRSSGNSDWGSPQNLAETVNSASTDAASCISADGLELYFNSDRPGGLGHFDLYVARRATGDGLWDQAENLGSQVNTPDIEAFPCISRDGRELYFMSMRASGYGAYDLYVSTRATTDALWGRPVNLGPVVNSPYWETGPCLSADGLRLFFQDYLTPRPGGYGRGDIWMTQRASRFESWGPPVNLGPRINGASFEHRPCLAPDGSALYFARESDGTITHWKASIIPAGGSDLNGKAKGKKD
ncbi:MAG: TolB family protein, partial [Solirubrobacterales bacterium]